LDHLFWIIPLAVFFVLLLGVLLLVWLLRRKPPLSVAQVRSQFQQQRIALQAAFFEAAARCGKPRGLRWKGCEWSDLIAWVRDKGSGQILALVGVTISFEAIEGSDMEGVEAVGNLRNASAVFFYQNGTWQTVGRVIFNLNPDEAVLRFQEGYTSLSEPEA
jgi:hypothetical protein